MRKIYFLTLSLLVLFSCKSIEKMVESGNYDQAFYFAIDKLAGKKTKETKYVRGLEKAYDELQARELSHIDYLLSIPHNHLWDEIAQAYVNMDRRQNALRPLLPLVSEDGYRASFDFKDWNKEIANARQEAAEYKYQEAVSKVEAGRDGNKLAAQRAYDMLKNVLAFNPNYKDARDLQDEAYDLGLEYYGIEFIANVPMRSRAAVDAQINGFNATAYNTFWRKFYLMDRYDNDDYDGIFTISIDDLDFGTERESIEHYDVEKTITDGKRTVYDKNGNAIRDSLGKVITEPNKIKVKAYVSEIRREKTAQLFGSISYYAQNANYAASTTPIEVQFHFDDLAANFRGDHRALDQRLISLTKKDLLAFPENNEMTAVLAKEFIVEVTRRIPSVRINQV